MKRYFLFLSLFLACATMRGGSIDDIRQALESGAASQVQEKVYIHTDNQCYFVGDTLWYKAYVVRADDLRPTDMSRLLYVELLSPDGLLVERQTIIISPKGYTCGQFALRDSLYSGYYELRAYTRWMLNFNVRHHRYRKDETWSFYNKQMAADYFRIWDGLYSRVLPVYSKPEATGDYDARRMYQRPKTRLPRQKKDNLVVTFYPEGGQLVQGVENRVAFEVTDQHGQAVSVKGTIVGDGSNRYEEEIETEYMGRGSFLVTPTEMRLKARFTWHDKEWTVDLPKAEKQGVAMRLEGGQLVLSCKGLPADKEYGLSVMCRGRLVHFTSLQSWEASATGLQSLEASPTTELQSLEASPATGLQSLEASHTTGLQSLEASHTTGLQSWEASPTTGLQSLEASPTTQSLEASPTTQSLEASHTTGLQSLEASPTMLQRLEALPIAELPTGVNDVTVFDSDGRIWASRLFFVNHHDYDASLITAPLQATRTYAPYEKIEVPVQLAGITEPTTFSLSFHDTNTDEPSYDDGNLMTSMLLSSELRGFVARPAHYFEADDDLHRRHLDLLMMVQGWRKYKWQELADTTHAMRYQPETTMTVEGAVYKALGINDVDPDEVSSWQDGVGMIARKSAIEDEAVAPFADESDEAAFISTDAVEVSENAGAADIEYGHIDSANDHVGVNHGNLRHEVLVEAEISIGGQCVGGIQKTRAGRFLFQVPPFYGDAYLNMKAYKESDSIVKNMASRKDKKVLDELAFPDFYVKRDLFWPVYTHDYTYYEKHQPDYTSEMLIDTLSEWSMENDVHHLGNINVKGHRRGRRAIDWKKPAYVVDAYDIYNEITDRGLSFGKFDMRQFPIQVCKLLYGNMNRHVSYHVDGRIGGHVYYRNYSPLSGNGAAETAGQFRANRTSQAVYRNLFLKRLQDVRVFSDFEPRTEDSLMVENRYTADATVDLVNIGDDGVQPTFRDRHIVLHGINAPEDFYQPDYSHAVVGSLPADYRRTLYWNPNAVCDEQGRFKAVFYNNGKETRIRMTAAGITAEGRLMH